jgi:uncharacterized membrane protein
MIEVRLFNIVIFNQGRKFMRVLLSIVGILLVLAGIVWFFQGINILPGSFMTGQTQWAVYGVLAILTGGGLVVYANRSTIFPPR